MQKLNDIQQKIAELKSAKNANTIFNCCEHHEPIKDILTITAGIQQRLLQKFEEQYGIPKSDPFSFSQSNPVAHTLYVSPAAMISGVIRSLIIVGPGNVTLSLNNGATITGAITICKMPCSGVPVIIPHHIRIPVGATFTLSTDSSGETLMSMSAMIEPSSLEGSDMLRVRR